MSEICIIQINIFIQIVRLKCKVNSVLRLVHLVTQNAGIDPKRLMTNGLKALKL